MMHYFFVQIFFLLLFLATPGITHAQTQSDPFAAQLNAISGFLTRTFVRPFHEPLSSDELRSVIEGGAEWFSNVQEENGHLRYEYAPYRDELLEDDNIVRQAGALYVLGEIARRDSENSLRTKETIERSIAYFDSLTREDAFEGQTFRCVVVNRVSKTCQLGATSLALAGLLGYLQAHPEEIPKYEALVEDYASFILAMKMPGRGFRREYRVGESNQTKEESPYFNGESLMALTRFFAYEPDPEVWEVIEESFTHLQKLPFDGALYLWIMAALKDMHAIAPHPEYVTYAEAFTDWRIASVRPFRGSSRNYCAFSEGLASAYSVLSESVGKPKRESLLAELNYWLHKDSVLQITPQDRYRVMTNDGTLSLERLTEPDFALGGFLTSEDTPTLRIDFTQHCLAAYLQALVDIKGETL